MLQREKNFKTTKLFLRRVGIFVKGKYVEKNIQTADFMTGCR